METGKKVKEQTHETQQENIFPDLTPPPTRSGPGFPKKPGPCWAGIALSTCTDTQEVPENESQGEASAFGITLSPALSSDNKVGTLSLVGLYINITNDQCVRS